jgi:GNAT superfamily N-acetyltransferase
VNWDEAPIGKKHERAAFDCGDADLNIYLKQYARQNHESGGAKCFLAVTTEQPTRILGFYTLSPASLEYARTPALAKRELGRSDVPMFRIGRLAVDQTVQGRGLGGSLLLRAAARCIRVAQEVGASRFSSMPRMIARPSGMKAMARCARVMPLCRSCFRSRGP